LARRRPEEDRLSDERLALLRQLSRDAIAGRLTRQQIEDLQSKVRHIDDTLDAAGFEKKPHDDAAAALAHPISLRALQDSVLPDRTALVEYFLGDERSFLMCVTRGAYRLIELPSARSIEDSLAAYLSFLEDPSIAAGKGLPAARRVYEELLQPAINALPGDVNRLVIVPDGVLFRLPFETLTVETSRPSPAAYLNDRYLVSYAPSASVLAYLKQAPKRPYFKDALAFGVSAYGKQAAGRGPGYGLRASV
jgi:hypothetical protein